jgi:hypothetical protein
MATLSTTIIADTGRKAFSFYLFMVCIGNCLLYMAELYVSPSEGIQGEKTGMVLLHVIQAVSGRL